MSAQLSFTDQPAKRKTQWELIFDLMETGAEYNLSQLQRYLQLQGHWYSETSISARLRELARGKKPGWTVTKRTENGRTYFYKVVRA